MRTADAAPLCSLPCLKRVVPGGLEGVKIHVKLGVPIPDKRIDADAIKKARRDALRGRACVRVS